MSYKAKGFDNNAFELDIVDAPYANGKGFLMQSD